MEDPGFVFDNGDERARCRVTSTDELLSPAVLPIES